MALSPTSSRGGSQPVLTVVKHITSAQLLASFTTPITLLADPGAGLVVIPWSLYCVQGPGSSLYTLADTITLNTPDVSANLAGLIGLLTASGPSGYASWDFSAGAVGGTGNFGAAGPGPVTFLVDNDNPTGGDFPITVTFGYLLFTL